MKGFVDIVSLGPVVIVTIGRIFKNVHPQLLVKRQQAEAY